MSPYRLSYYRPTFLFHQMRAAKVYILGFKFYVNLFSIVTKFLRKIN